MAHFCFMAFGSRGDIQPLVAVAAQLVKMGHRATLCTGARFRKMAEERGICFKETALDLMELADSEEGKKIFQSPFRNASLARKLMREYILPRFRTSLDQCYEAAQGADVVVYHPKVFGAVDMAESLGIPCVVMPAVPILYPVEEFPNLGLMVRSMGSFLNKLSYKVNDWAEGSYIKAVNDFRDKTLHLPSRKAGVYARQREGKEIPILYPFSRLLFPDVKSWEGHVQLPGFCFLERPGTLTEDVELFIREGEKPLVVTFGSVEMPEKAVFFGKLVKALKQTGNRAICIGEKAGFVGNTSGDSFIDSQVLFVKEAPFLALFPRVKGVICHAGIGTGSTALQCGVPLISMPISADQPFWARRYEQIGCAAATLDIKHCTVEGMVDALNGLETPALQAKVHAVSEALKQENGILEAARYLIGLVNET